MTLRMIKTCMDNGVDISYINNFLVYYMMHDDSVTGVYKKNGWHKNDMKFVDRKNSESAYDYYMK